MDKGITESEYQRLTAWEQGAYLYKLQYRYHNGRHVWTWYFKSEGGLQDHWAALFPFTDKLYEGAA